MSKQKPPVISRARYLRLTGLFQRLERSEIGVDMLPLPRDVQKAVTDHVNAGKRRRRK